MSVSMNNEQALEEVSWKFSGPLDDKTSTVDGQFWWNHVHPPLLTLMLMAEYDDERCSKYAAFVREMMPFLGPRPETLMQPWFDSFCNDDFTPIELSLSVYDHKTTVRIGIEAIGLESGRAGDPFNQKMTDTLVAQLIADHPHIDQTLWEHFKQELSAETNRPGAVISQLAENEHMTVNTISFDLQGVMTPKIYFYPFIRAVIDEGGHAGGVVARAVKKLDINVQTAFDLIVAFVVEYKKKYGNMLRLETVAFDSKQPTESRVKIYVRTPQTSLSRVCEIFTLGGRLRGEKIDKAVEGIHALWRYVLDVERPDQELPPSNHRTAGIIFNFELRHEEDTPFPCVYLPPRHYGGTDLKIAKGLSTFFDWCGWRNLAESYVSDIQKAFPAQNFSSTIGRHSYIKVAYGSGGYYVKMYYNLMVYSTGHEVDEEGRLIGPAAKKQRHVF